MRVFILGNMMIPALVTSIWTTIMGGLGAKMEYTAMEMGLGEGCMYNTTYAEPISNGTITRLSCVDVDQQMFVLIEHYPMAQFFSVLGLIGILGYFVTSSDSASFVIDMITSNGMVESPKIQRIFWALSEVFCLSKFKSIFINICIINELSSHRLQGAAATGNVVSCHFL